MPMVEDRPSESVRTTDGMTRELLALTVDVRAGNEQALGPRIAALVRMGATRADIQEALSAAIMRGGRRSLRHAIDALAYFDNMTSRRETST